MQLNNFTSTFSLSPIVVLLREKESKINSLINNLKIGDVREDENFNDTTNRIKQTILLTPVTIGEPKYIDHEYEERPLNMTEQLLGRSKDHYIYTISFQFTGSDELFNYVPDGFSVSSSDHGVIMPYSRQITVKVDLPVLDTQRAIAVANDYLSLTKQLIEGNNITVSNWTTGVEQTINERLKQKREELIKNFG